MPKVLPAENERTESPVPMDERPRFENYELPPAVESAMTSWVKNADAVAVIMALFATVQIVLLQVLPPLEGASSTLWKATRWFMYCGIFLHLGGAISAVAVIQMAASLPVKGRNMAMSDRDSRPRRVFIHQERIPLELLTEEGENTLLAEWGLRTRWRATNVHMIVCFVLGFASASVSLILWVWSYEAYRTVLGATLIPILLFAGSTFYIALIG